MAADAFWQNDPYYPRPSYDEDTIEGKIWSKFKEVYLAKDKEILGSTTQPEDFIDLLEAEAESKKVDLVIGGPPKALAVSSEEGEKDKTGKKKHSEFFSFQGGRNCLVL